MISIIIPAYNAELTISRIIDSILKQTYFNWELLIINDGSTDSTGSICESYLKKDNRIRLFNQENSGVSIARNVGIKNSIGKFITFIDSDDNVSLSYLEDLYNDYELNDNPDLVCHGYIIIGLDGNTKNCNIKDSILIRKNNGTDLLNDEVFKCFMSSCTKLFIADIIKKNDLIFDQSLKYGEDTVFTLNYIMRSESIYISNKANYYYIRRLGSATDSFLPYHSLLLSCDRMLGATNLLLIEFNIPTYHIVFFIINYYGWLFWIIFKSVHNCYTKKERIDKILSMPPCFFIGIKLFMKTKGLVGKFISIFLYGKLPIYCDFFFVILFKIEKIISSRKLKK